MSASFVRWQKIARDQLGATAKLILTLTTGAIAFVAHLITTKDRAPLSDLGRNGLVASAVFLAVSAVLGILINLTRLLDFRWTARTRRIEDIIDGIGKGRKTRMPHWIEEALPPSLKGKVTRHTDVATVSPADWEKVVDKCRWKNEKYGDWTWRLMPYQLGLFVLGVVCLAFLWPQRDANPPATTEKATVRGRAGIVKLGAVGPFASGRPQPPESVVGPQLEAIRSRWMETGFGSANSAFCWSVQRTGGRFLTYSPGSSDQTADWVWLAQQPSRSAWPPDFPSSPPCRS